MANLPPASVKVGARALAPLDMNGKELKAIQNLQPHRDRVSAVCLLGTGGIGHLQVVLNVCSIQETFFVLHLLIVPSRYILELAYFHTFQ